MDLKPQGSQLKTVRQKANIFKNWLLSEVDLTYIRKIKQEHPAEFFRGVIQSLPKEMDIELTSNIINVIRHLDSECKQDLINVNKSKVIEGKEVLTIVNNSDSKQELVDVNKSKDKESGVGRV